MNDRVCRIGNFASKQLDDATASYATLITQRSERLNSAEVCTPILVWDPDSNTMVSPWIDGITGRAHLSTLQAGGNIGDWCELPEAEQVRLLEPLVRLHNASQAGMGLEPIDIWRRITPRLTSGSSQSPMDSLPGRAQHLYTGLRGLQAAMESKYADRNLPLHGDYHVNQLIIAESTGKPWLLDLDDMALGLPEFDLGNFVANLATTRELLLGGVMQDYAALKATLCPAYESLGGRTPDPELIDFYAAVSLLRRSLKSRELGRSNPDSEEILGASEILAGRLKTKETHVHD